MKYIIMITLVVIVLLLAGYSGAIEGLSDLISTINDDFIGVMDSRVMAIWAIFGIFFALFVGKKFIK